MDFANRGNRQADSTVNVNTGSSHKSSKKLSFKATKIMTVVLLFSVTLVAVSLITLLAIGGKQESSYIKKGKYQAVFLNGGQVYFGKIGVYKDKYLTLSDIFYLRVNQQVQPGQTSATNANDVSLAKLGSELHGPEDQMVLNRSEVQFWENLKDDGQVVKAITEYKKNPSAADAAPANTADTATGNQQQTNTTPTKSTTPVTTKKP
ncbi:MAG: hypothetical protein WCJ60_02565 [bacterium]